MPSPVLLDHGFATTEGREIKARKIEAVVANFMGACEVAAHTILDIGCGSGHIAAYFARHNRVIACDVVDQVTTPQRTCFELVLADTAHLPFADGGFDVILSNHVVAYLRDPQRHIREIARLLKPGGVAYIATPNRYFPLEPHTRTPLVHWLPAPLYRWVMRRLTGRSDARHVPGYGEIIAWFGAAHLTSQDYTMRIINDPERFHMPASHRIRLPEACKWLSPTCVFMVSR
jgi:SAM-dependent methyltransferase